MNIAPVIPAIDILDGKVVRLTKGDYNERTFYDQDPVELIKSFESAGAKRIHLVDLNGAKDGTLVNLPIFEQIRKATTVKLELGGGIRTIESAQKLIDSGINFIILGSILLKDFKTSVDIINKFPNQVIAGIDTKQNFVAVEGWLETSTLHITDLIKEINALPIESIIYTDIEKDGTLTGPNMESLERIANISPYPIIASGGVGTLSHIEDIQKLEHQNISGIIVGKAILNGNIPIANLFN